ncbi:hypothetical protein Tco_0709064, partial [Tanacetum coccineum]
MCGEGIYTYIRWTWALVTWGFHGPWPSYLFKASECRNDASGSGPIRGRDTAPAIHECTFDGFMKCNPAAFHGVEGAVKLQ